ncbi:MAG: AraC family transcriptional regulator [Proteobacteria bacterium]|nr:AraC family transcriptional regulator [Pseudomonadota bacterium]
MIRVGAMEGYRNLVFELGCDPAPMLLAAGIDPALLDQPDRLITTVRYRQALNIAARETGVERFGLILSQRQTFEKFGAVGYLARHAPSLAVSIDSLIRFLKTHDAGSMNAIEVVDDIALWSHNLAGVTYESAVQQTELAVGLGCRFVRSALAEDWRPDRVLFEHAPPANVEIFGRIFRCPVLFDQPLTAMEFPAADLRRPLRSTDAGLFEILERHVAQISSQITDDLPSRVKTHMQRTIEDGPIRLDVMAG